MIQTPSSLCQMSMPSYNILTTINQLCGASLHWPEIFVMTGVLAFLSGFISTRYVTGEISLNVH